MYVRKKEEKYVGTEGHKDERTKLLMDERMKREKSEITTI